MPLFPISPLPVLLLTPSAAHPKAETLRALNLNPLHHAALPSDLTPFRLAVISLGSEEEDAQAAEACRGAGLLVNVVDRPHLCDFIFPAVIQRGDVQVAVSTGGRAPVLARWLKNRIAASLPSGIGRVAALGEKLKDTLRRAFPDMQTRKNFWEDLLDSGFTEAVSGVSEAEAEQAFLRAIEDKTASRGSVALIGAGPGDPDLLTFRALRLLQAADVVVYDRLVTPEVLTLARKDAEKIYVGKARAHHCVPQGEINQTLVDHALAGKRVARLKGGDSLLFGRAGEEMAALKAAGVPFVIVPGVTSASAAAAALETSLSHRDHAQAVTFLTGHRRDNGELVLPWAALASGQQTLVIYMGIQSAAAVAQGLLKHGLSPDTPAAVVAQASWPGQSIIRCCLGNLATTLEREQPSNPALLIIGTVLTDDAARR